jgi:monoterpene epsilon-lactone hydrolase
MPSKQHEALVQQILEGAVTDAPSLEDQRAGFEATLAATPIADDISIEPFRIGIMDADWVSAPNSQSDRVILYFHGGGYVLGSNVGYREFAGRLARATAARICVINYRLAPESPFPAAVDDAVSAYEYLLGNGFGASQIAVAGDSAGGGLALATLVRLRDQGIELPASGICFSPWIDLEGSGTSAQPGGADDPMVAKEGLAGMATLYAGDDLTNPLAAPLHAKLNGLPPMQILVGTREVLLDDARRARDNIKQGGGEVSYFEGEGLIHVWPVLVPDAPESADALQRVAQFAASHWS